MLQRLRWEETPDEALRPILVVVTIQSVIWDFKVFTQIHVMINGGAFPLYWMVLSDFEPAGEVESTEPRPWTSAPSSDSFRRVFGQREFGRYFLNGLVVACLVVVVSALIAFLAATAVTRFRFRFRTTLLIMFVVAQMVPAEALTIPLFLLIRDLGQLNTLGALILPHIAFSLSFAVWMLRGFVKAVPEALEEAAYIDGASRSRFLWQILFPLVFPGLVATGVFSFISAWNDFLFAESFVISDTSQSTLPMDGDDDSGAGVLRTRAAPTGVGARWSG
jgi:N,N'-diacetylchitobiose transport system permease protein